MSTNFTIEFSELEKYKTILCNKSGLYYFYLSYNKELLYVGEAIDLYKRMVQYKKDNGEGRNNRRVIEVIRGELDNLRVAFQPFEASNKSKKELKRYLREKEANTIHELVPLFNKEENPRYLINPIQKVIGKEVSKINREITFSVMREYLFRKWQGKVSYDLIDKALVNKNCHLSRYCKTSQKNKTLNPKTTSNQSEKSVS